MPLQLHNTMTRTTESLKPRDPARVTFYTCGPTVYDDAHIGNFRAFLAADLLRRWIESPLCALTNADGSPHAGPRRVVHVMNITDVGHMTDDAIADGGGQDKMSVAGQRLLQAKKAGTLPPGVAVDPDDPAAIASFYADRFLADARALGLRVALEQRDDPTLMPRASDAIASMIAMVERLVERRCAYVVGEPGARVVYFDVTAFAHYGALSGNTLEALRAGSGGRVSEHNQATKRHPGDFLLWKEDASHIMKWPSPWGTGYPGWHIECSAMSVDRLVTALGLDASQLSARGLPLIDLHSGGEDNIFPHHECENAQSCCAFGGQAFAGMWFHARFLLVNGAKMSKSAGNFFTVRQLLERGIAPAAIRLELIKTHYRSNANFTDQGLKDAGRMIERWRGFVARAERSTDDAPTGVPVAGRVADALNDDLNIAGALGAINGWINEVAARDAGPTRGDAQLMRSFDDILGLLSLDQPKGADTDIGVFAPGVAPDQAVVDRLIARRDARARKDFAQADAIRDELLAMGYAIKDIAGGRVEVARA